MFCSVYQRVFLSIFGTTDIDSPYLMEMRLENLYLKSYELNSAENYCTAHPHVAGVDPEFFEGGSESGVDLEGKG